MSRTTLDLDPSVLQELKRRKAREGKSMGRLASELLAVALSTSETPAAPAFHWSTRSMGARVDIEDAEALRRALDGQ